MTDQTSGIYNFQDVAILAHPTLDQPKKFKRNGKEVGEPKFSASFVADAGSQDIKNLKEMCMKVAKARWPARDIVSEMKAGTFKMPITAGDKLADAYIAKRKKEGKEDDGKGEFQRGKMVVKTSSKYAPQLSGFENGKVVDYDRTTPLYQQAKGKFFFGAHVLPQLNLVPYEGVDGNPDGVTAYLNMVLTTGKGERLASGARSAADAFKGYVGHASEEDPTAGAEPVADAAGW